MGMDASGRGESWEGGQNRSEGEGKALVELGAAGLPCHPSPFAEDLRANPEDPSDFLPDDSRRLTHPPGYINEGLMHSPGTMRLRGGKGRGKRAYLAGKPLEWHPRNIRSGYNPKSLDAKIWKAQRDAAAKERKTSTVRDHTPHSACHCDLMGAFVLAERGQKAHREAAEGGGCGHFPSPCPAEAGDAGPEGPRGRQAALAAAGEETLLRDAAAPVWPPGRPVERSTEA